MLVAFLREAAKHSLCFAKLPPHTDPHILGAVLDIPKDGVIPMVEGLPRVNRSNISCAVQVGYWFDEEDDVQANRYYMQKVFLERGKARCNTTLGGDRSLVMHMRGGDIMLPSTPSNTHPQPPCSFYEDVMEHGNDGMAFQRALLVTQDFRNPCVKRMRQKYVGRLTVQSSSIHDDACALISATSLAISSSTWGSALARLNPNLRNLYVPFGKDNGTNYSGHLIRGDGEDWYRESFAEDAMPYTQHLYTFPGYNTSWDDWDDRVAKMQSYPAAAQIRRIVPASDTLV